MTLFAHRFAVADPAIAIEVPGRYDAARCLRVDALGAPVVDQPGVAEAGTGTRAHPDPDRRFSGPLLAQRTTKADPDPPRRRAIGTGTKGGVDPERYTPLLTMKTSAGRDPDAAAIGATHRRRAAGRPLSAGC